MGVQLSVRQGLSAVVMSAGAIPSQATPVPAPTFAPTIKPPTDGGFVLFPPAFIEPTVESNGAGSAAEEQPQPGESGMVLFPPAFVEGNTDANPGGTGGATGSSQASTAEGGFMLFPPVSMRNGTGAVSSAGVTAGGDSVEDSEGIEGWVVLILILSCILLCGILVAAVLAWRWHRRRTGEPGEEEHEKVPFNKVVPQDDSKEEQSEVSQQEGLASEAGQQKISEESPERHPSPPPPLPSPDSGASPSTLGPSDQPPLLMEEPVGQATPKSAEEKLPPLEDVATVAVHSPVVGSSSRPEVSMDGYYVKHILPTMGTSMWDLCSLSRFASYHKDLAERRLKEALEGDSETELLSAVALARAKGVPTDVVWFAEVCRRRRVIVTEIRGLIGDKADIDWRVLWAKKACVLQELRALARTDPRAALHKLEVEAHQ